MEWREECEREGWKEGKRKVVNKRKEEGKKA